MTNPLTVGGCQVFSTHPRAEFVNELATRDHRVGIWMRQSKYLIESGYLTRQGSISSSRDIERDKEVSHIESGYRKPHRVGISQASSSRDIASLIESGYRKPHRVGISQSSSSRDIDETKQVSHSRDVEDKASISHIESGYQRDKARVSAHRSEHHGQRNYPPPFKATCRVCTSRRIRKVPLKRDTTRTRVTINAPCSCSISPQAFNPCHQYHKVACYPSSLSQLAVLYRHSDSVAATQNLSQQ